MATGLLGMSSLIATAYFGTTACGDSATDTEPDATPVATVGQPVAKPNAPASANTEFRTFAASELRLGLSDRAGVESTTAWKSYGYNLDGKVSEENSTDICKGDSSVRKDGDNGIDNAFGRKIAPSLKVASATFEPSLNTAIQMGAFTIMFDIKGLTGDPNQSATGLSGSVFGGGLFKKGSTPTFTTADDWPASRDSLKGDTIESGANVTFTDAYVNNGVFVARTPELVVSVLLGGKPLNLRIRKAIITFKVDGPNATEGTLAGVLTTKEFISELKAVGPYLSTMLCGSGAAILDSFASASDIMADSTNASGVSCDGISLAIGFNAKQIGRPTRVDQGGDASSGGDPCGGGDAGH